MALEKPSVRFEQKSEPATAPSNSRCFFKPLSRIASSALKKKHFADFLALY
ncbi:hypothetical protein [Endozoicomonas sp. 4G]|uniref:hypothetical protein n=1 Tax=Endozoicomonas sp. 4G TaxID=2872754 RepID=UPI0020785611|nr:hypothetical protein [Endozoicomonas sp. 4G]